MQTELMFRPRLNILLTQAVKKPITIVCASMGSGKTRAVYDFTQNCNFPVTWMQITDADNIGLRLWELFLHAIGKTNRKLAEEYRKQGFPDTEDKLNLYTKTLKNMTNGMRCMFVFDDFHLLNDAAVLRFMEHGINNLPENVSIILISREFPKINISKLIVQDRVFIINDSELSFTESEISQLLVEQGLASEIGSLKKIYNDTNGWALSIGFIMRMLKSSPGYMGYVSDAAKSDIFQLIEMVIWDMISEKLKTFLLRLSLIRHYSAGLIDILSGGDENLITELKTQNAFIRFNNHMASWHIHPSLLDFLHIKQSLLSAEEMCVTYKTTADWCIKNNFIVDALSYYEKTGNYERIVSVLLARQPQFMSDNAHQLLDIFNLAPEDVFDRVDFFAVLHVQVVFYTYGLQKAIKLADSYEAKYLLLPERDNFRNKLLGSVYYIHGFFRIVESTFTDRYDFYQYFVKLNDCFNGFSIDAKCWYQHPTGLWTNMAGASRAGAPQEFADAMACSSLLVQKCVNGMTAGFDDLCRGELLYYQDKVNDSKILFRKSLEKAMERGQFIIIHRAMFYIMRSAVFQGDYAAAEQMLKKMEEQLINNEDVTCVINSEISIAWLYCALHLPEMIPNWLKEPFAPYMHASTLENFGNQIKARYCYQTKNYAPLLSFMEEKKRRESILFERVEILAMEACVHFKMSNKNAAFMVLQEAYETAEPNGINMPFIEFGKDMRSLITAAASDADCAIPQEWLTKIKQMASIYSRNQELIISEYKSKNEIKEKITLSPREIKILHEMYKGLSNSEIAAELNLSINTVKMHIGGIYNKTGARNKADVFRIAAENNLLAES